LEINIPGQRQTVIFMLCRLNNFVKITEALSERTPEFLNKVVSILH